MPMPFINGEKLYLRTLNDLDIPNYVDWLNDCEVTRFMEIGKYPSTPESIRKYLNRFQESNTDLILAIVDKKDNQHIGNVTLNHISAIHRTASTGLLIGCKDFWGKGYASEAWSLIIEHAFQRLGLRKIIAGAISENTPSLAALKKLGFKIEATLRQEFLVNGEYKDAHLLGLFQQEFQKFTPSKLSGL